MYFKCSNALFQWLCAPGHCALLRPERHLLLQQALWMQGRGRGEQAGSFLPPSVPQLQHCVRALGARHGSDPPCTGHCPGKWEKQLARSFWRAHKERKSSIFQVCLHQFGGWETAFLPFLWLQQKVGRMNFILTTSLLSESLPLFLNLHIFMCLFSGLQQTPVVGRSCQCKMPRSSQGNFSSWLFSQARQVSQLV